MKEKISIIIPIYNTATYLDRCISSIIAQSYKNIEILLINDGSTDNSGHICSIWAAKDKRIKVIHKKNSGVSNTRNMGLSIAQGELIAFVDSDDYLSPNIYERLYCLMKYYSCDLAICGRTRICEGKTIKYADTGIQIFYDGKIDMRKLGCQYDLNISVNKLYKKQYWTNLRFPENMTYAEDLFITPDILSQSHKAVYTSEGLYYYYERNTSASFMLNDQKLINDIQAKEKFYSFMCNKQVDTQIAFDWLFGAYVRGYKQSKSKKKDFKRKYNRFFQNHFRICMKKTKCILFYLSPSSYFLFK